MSLEEEKAGCRAVSRRQAADSQCNRAARRVTAHVCNEEKVDFCRETWEMPNVSWKPELGRGRREGGVQRHVQAAGRHEPIQSSNKRSDYRRVQQGEGDFCRKRMKCPKVFNGGILNQLRMKKVFRILIARTELC